ncbi:MAG: hypothetical protein H6732_03070 [Alphaproteobacteria bacterium]|nr:hypothetical protein [Alphaproteobacteria bacterium]
MRRGAPGLLALLGCGEAAPEVVQVVPTEARGWSVAERDQLASLLLDTHLPADPTNRWADDPAAAALGRRLFYDPGLSPTGTLSCATCHDPARHFTDGRALAVGLGTASRSAPALEGMQQGPWFFWDGRADSLWSQALGPLESAVEMGSDRVHLAHHVAAAWREPYEAIFGPLPAELATLPAHARPDREADHPLAVAWASLTPAQQAAATGVAVNAAKAIAAFERTLLPAEAPFDRYVGAVLSGDPEGGGHLDPAAVRGLRLFLGPAGCTACHHGPMFTDRAFHPLGLPEPRGYDPGRTVGALSVLESELSCRGPWSDTTDCEELRFLNPAFEDFRGAFKTPTLRNVTATAPYMHAGQLADLDAVLAFYAELPSVPVVGHRELTLQPLALDPGQRADLIAFLGSLEAPVRPEALPPAP